MVLRRTRHCPHPRPHFCRKPVPPRPMMDQLAGVGFELEDDDFVARELGDSWVQSLVYSLTTCFQFLGNLLQPQLQEVVVDLTLEKVRLPAAHAPVPRTPRRLRRTRVSHRHPRLCGEWRRPGWGAVAGGPACGRRPRVSSPCPSKSRPRPANPAQQPPQRPSNRLLTAWRRFCG